MSNKNYTKSIWSVFSTITVISVNLKSIQVSSQNIPDKTGGARTDHVFYKSQEHNYLQERR